MHHKHHYVRRIFANQGFTLPIFLVLAALWVCWSAQAQHGAPAPRAARPAHRLSGFTPVPVGLTPTTQTPTEETLTGGPLGLVTTSFEGIPYDPGFLIEPPDPHGAAGPSGIIQTVNLRIKYWNKSGQGIWGPIDLWTFWSSVGINPNNILSDPRVVYDTGSGRFYVTLLEADDATSKSYLNLAVSKTSNPSTFSSGDWFFYRIEDTQISGGTSYWTDYPGMGFDDQAVYVTYNMYSFPSDTGRYKNAVIIILNKAAFNSGTTNYNFVYTPDNALGFTLQPCSMIGFGGPTNIAYFAETPVLGKFSTTVRIWALTNPLRNPTLTSATVTVPNNGGYPPFSGAPQAGTTDWTIDTLDGRTQGNAFWFNGSVWFCTTAGGSSEKSIVWYYNINLNGFPSGTPTVGEAGSIDGGPGVWTYQPSIGANSQGDVAIVYCQSSASTYPTIFAATRGVGAPAFGTSVLIKASPTWYYGVRWGDYASVTHDPVDDSFWVTHEFAKSSAVVAWGTWWAQLPAVSSKPDGILEVAFTPGNGTTLVAGKTQPVFVQVADGLAVTNATVTATVNGTNLNFLNNGVAPDVTANDGIYSANLSVPNSTNDITLNFLITAPGKTNSTNVITYSVVPLPPNDFFTNATKVPPEGAVYFSNNKFATMEFGEPQHAGVAGAAASLWWNWSPASSTNVFLDTTGSQIDTIVAVYQGTAVTNLTPVIATNDVGSKQQAYLSFNAVGGASYRIAVASVNTNNTGSLRFLIAPGGSLDTNPPTVTVASPLSGQWVSNFLLTVTGTAADPQPNASGVTRVLVSVNGRLPLTADGTTTWSSTFGLDEGLNHITVTAVDFAGNVSTPVTIEVTYIITRLANDLFVNALPLTGNTGTVTAVTTNATKEFGEPDHAGNAGGRSVWWYFQAPADGALSLSTSNSTFDTLLGLYTGDSVSALTTIASNDDAYPGAPGGFSALTHAVRSNVTYHIAVDGFDGASGNAVLGYNFTPAPLFTLTLSSAGNGQAAGPAGDVVSNSTVTVTATADPFFEFANWSGSFLATANPLSFVVSSNVQLTANFQPITFTDDFESGNLHKLTWSTAGNRPWLVESTNVLAGSYSARSGAITNSQSSSLLLTTNFFAGNGSFYFKVSSEPNFDFFTFLVDGVQQQQWSGEVDWSSFSFPIASGTHTLEWRYSKDQSFSSGLDAAFIDDVLLPIRPPVSASSAATLHMVRQADGTLYVSLLGQTNQQYVIQGAVNLLHPTVWQNLSTNTATGGVIQFVDPGAATNQLRFYRAVVAQ